jgi:hypothetical protein
MRLSLDVIRDELKQQFDFADSASNLPYAMELRAAAVLTSEPPEPHTLYVAEARRLPVHWKFSGHVSLLVVGRVNALYFKGRSVDYLCILDNRFFLVLNAVLDIFRRYGAFSDTLKNRLIQGVAPDALCNYIAEILDIPFVVFDLSLRILYISPDAMGLLEWEQDSYSGLRLLPTEFFNQLNLVYRKTEENHIGDAVLLKDDRLSLNLITTYSRRNNYNILAFETERELDRRALAIVGYVNVFLVSAFGQAAHSQEAPALSSLVLSLLEGNKLSTVEMKNQLDAVSWKPEDNYCCVVLKKQKNTQPLKDIHTFCQKLENQFAACVAAPFKNRIVAVINLDKSKCPFFDISRRIAFLLRDGLLRAGISFRYWSFETTPIYYQQAEYAHEMGELYAPDSWCYHFKDYALYYLLHYGSSKIPPRHLCHPGLVNLYTYDQKNGTELLHTLEVYIQCNCNAVTAAHALYIHRNTFYQRLSKIQKIENLDLESSDERLYILMSTKMISMYYYELQHGYMFPRE